MCTPRAWALARPSLVRAWIKLRSNSASTARCNLIVNGPLINRTHTTKTA
jgi:hypothetical protein